MQKHRLKSDAYRKARGGSAQFLNLFCAKCHTHLALYQKDGPGRLLRLYYDRIFEPASFVAEASEAIRVGGAKRWPKLVCPECDELIGSPMVYERENRPALLLQLGAVAKSKSDGSFPVQSVGTHPGMASQRP